jgi:hypothetical protein
MDIQIISIEKANDLEWNSVWQDCDYSTYFHSREWAEIWNKYTGGKIQPKPLLIKFSDGAKALLPLSSRRILKGLARQYISSPAGTFGGWISLDELYINHGQLLVDYICRKLGFLTWRLNPYDKIVSQCKFSKIENDETHALNLKEGFDSIYHSWTKGHKSAARKARNGGIIIQKADRQEHWQKYYAIYEDSLQRWGEEATSRYKWNLFEIFYALSSKNIELWLAKYEDKIIAGALCFYSKNHVVYWHGAALSDYFNMRPVNLLVYEVIKDACERNYLWFDFNPSGGHEGVKSFKKSFGAKPIPCPTLRIIPCLAKSIMVTQEKASAALKKIKKRLS